MVRDDEKMKVRDKNGKYIRPLPPYYCKDCGVLLTKDNWSDFHRNTKIHGRYYICNKCRYHREILIRQKNRKALEDEWNGVCFLCGRRYSKMVFHEINWIDHKQRHSNRWYKDNFNRFIFVCANCHQMLHQLHNVFGFEIEDLDNLLKEKMYANGIG